MTSGPLYRAPIEQTRFALRHVLASAQVFASPVFADCSEELIDSILDEAGKFAAGLLAPLNRSGDRHGATLSNGQVSASPGFSDAYRQFADAGWNSVTGSPEFGGQGLPHAIGLAIQEYWQAANVAFGLCPILSQGAIEAIGTHGTAEQKSLYLRPLIAGRWTGTMNLTEPQAGSDVGALKARAVRQEDGSYRISGTKIFITWGEHDAAENIVHLVLARLPQSPIGTRGISLFLVPKFLVNADGSLGARNDVTCTGLEHKLGIHGSPTCVMSYGDQGGATGFLIGAENKGMAAMFTMMNSARLNVGIQGVGVAERAFQAAYAYARDRRQGKPHGLSHDMEEMVPIIQHPDVRRMLMSMRTQVEAARAICLATALATDEARHGATPGAREAAKGREEVLTPIAKAWSTDMAVEVASIGVQIHGGMGFIEETGAAQYYRDARILPIYEGTNGIQAIDLIGRKLSLQNGAAMRALLNEVGETAAQCAGAGSALAPVAHALKAAHAVFAETTATLQTMMKSDAVKGLAGAAPFLRAAGLLAGGHFLARGAMAAVTLKDGAFTPAFLTARLQSAQFFAANLLAQVSGLCASATEGGNVLLQASAEELGA